MSAQWPTSHDGGEPVPSGSSSPDDPFHPRTPTSNVESPLLPSDSPPSKPPSRSFTSSNNFVSSPLNPNVPHANTVRSRPASRGSAYIDRIASEESRALTGHSLNSTARGSMVLYRLISDEANDFLLPPRTLQRDSVASSSGESIFSLSSDSKYPSGLSGSRSGFVPYAYDPDLDTKDEGDEEDTLHQDNGDDRAGLSCSGRGLLNLGVLLLLIGALLSLFVLYPVLNFFKNNHRNLAIDGNIRINNTGQAPVLFGMPQIIDPDTPDNAKSRTGFDGQNYELVFSDEFNVDGRAFYSGDDPYWEAVDLWYGATHDQEWYDPAQVTTKNGYLSIVMEQVADETLNHMLPYKSGMLQSWNKFCFTSGYIEVAVTLPGPDSNTKGYWPGAWTMGNLGRPGFGATTDGSWPYSYNDCDVGVLPNQTFVNGSGPDAALHTDAGREQYDFELSWLPGQRASACTCPGEEHPGPNVNVGRGAPEIDVLEVERNKTGGPGQVVSQSAQFAPFTHDYEINVDTQDEFTIYSPDLTRLNTYKGSAVQQAVSCLTDLPDDMFQGSGANFKTLGFEYWTDPDHPEDGFITWQTNGEPSYRMGAGAVGPDNGPDGAQVGQRRIPEEPMAIILNLGISSNWQPIDLTTMIFPAEMRVDYVRVYQRTGANNIGCNPARFPTEDYINSHLDAYTNPNYTNWSVLKPGEVGLGAGYPWPKNTLSGC